MQANTSQTEDLKPTPKQDKLIAALLAGKSIVIAAAAAGCNEATAHAWLKLPHVQAAYRDAQHVLFNESLATLMLNTDEAIGTLKTIMKDSEMPPASRIRAAQILLEQSIEIHKVSELEQKIAKLEERIKDHAT